MPGAVLEALLAPQARLEQALQQAVLAVITVREAAVLLEVVHMQALQGPVAP
jgi:hypothetical protein